MLSIPFSSSPPEVLLKMLQGLIPLTPEDYAAFTVLLRPLSLEKKALLLHEGDVCRQVAFIESGGLRYFYTVEGEEHTGTPPATTPTCCKFRPTRWPNW